VSAAEPEFELNGWRLLQAAKTMDAAYGDPHKVVEEDGVTSRVYFIDKQAYMVATTTRTFPNHIGSLQLTGITDKALPFLGLTLGAPLSKVLTVLGEPSTRVRIEEWKVSRYEYPGRNYSIEIDDNHKLYSIRIDTDATVASQIVNESLSPWGSFVDALASHDTGRILDQLRPDIEIYRHGRTLEIGQRFHDFAGSPEQEFMDALTGSRGVMNAIANVRPEELVRVTEKMGVGLVFKFPAQSVLDEIVFFPYAGRYRVYEIAFRVAPQEVGTRMLGNRSSIQRSLARSMATHRETRTAALR